MTLHETLFKLKQAILRKVFSTELGYKKKYMTDEVFRTVIKMFPSLAYVPVQHVQAVAQELFRHALTLFPEESMEKFIQYFQFTWTGVAGSEGGRFKLDFWNVRDRYRLFSFVCSFLFWPEMGQNLIFFWPAFKLLFPFYTG